MGNLSRACSAARIRSAVVRRWPTARQIQSYASSGVLAIVIKSSTVSSMRVQGGVMAGWHLPRMTSDR